MARNTGAGHRRRHLLDLEYWLVSRTYDEDRGVHSSGECMPDMETVSRRGNQNEEIEM